jgi:hypothetical protein
VEVAFQPPHIVARVRRRDEVVGVAVGISYRAAQQLLLVGRMKRFERDLPGVSQSAETPSTRDGHTGGSWRRELVGWATSYASVARPARTRQLRDQRSRAPGAPPSGGLAACRPSRPPSASPDSVWVSTPGDQPARRTLARPTQPGISTSDPRLRDPSTERPTGEAAAPDAHPLMANP